MKHILISALVVMLYVTYSECIPATLCRFPFRSGTRYQLKVRDSYDGETWAGRCSDDAVFCVYGAVNGVTLKYQNGDRLIGPSDWRTNNADGWCRAKGGVAYWFNT